MLLKVVNLKLRSKDKITRNNHFRVDYIVKFSPILFKMSSFFFKTGLRVKTIVTLSYLFNISFESFFFEDALIDFKYSFRFENFFKFFIKSLNDMFNFYDLNLLIKKIRTSRKVRKYSKGKLRYTSRLLEVRSRQMFGVILKLWKICFSSTGEDNENLRHKVMSSFFLIDESMMPETTPLLIQETMLDLYIKETSNRRN